MQLFFSIEDMRNLYMWDQGMEYLAICELASGDFPECHRDSFLNFDDFKICVEAKLTLLTCFNFLSEDQRARHVLYNVCRFNKSSHVNAIANDSDSKQQASDFEVVYDDKQFKARFPSYDKFENLFE